VSHAEPLTDPRRLNPFQLSFCSDCYMCATGLLGEDPQHAEHMLGFAEGMLRAAAQVAIPLPEHGSVRIRVGMHRCVWWTSIPESHWQGSRSLACMHGWRDCQHRAGWCLLPRS
jgi:hypothetical protein